MRRFLTRIALVLTAVFPGAEGGLALFFLPEGLKRMSLDWTRAPLVEDTTVASRFGMLLTFFRQSNGRRLSKSKNDWPSIIITI
jgi:hypothetical protein